METEKGCQPRDASMIQPMIMIRRMNPPTNANSARPVDSGFFLGSVDAGSAFILESKPTWKRVQGKLGKQPRRGRMEQVIN